MVEPKERIKSREILTLSWFANHPDVEDKTEDAFLADEDAGRGEAKEPVSECSSISPIPKGFHQKDEAKFSDGTVRDGSLRDGENSPTLEVLDIKTPKGLSGSSGSLSTMAEAKISSDPHRRREEGSSMSLSPKPTVSRSPVSSAMEAKMNQSENKDDSSEGEKFKDSFSLRARRHFQGNVDTDVGKFGTGTEGVIHQSGGSSPKDVTPSSAFQSLSVSGGAPSLNLPPINPGTPQLASVRKAQRESDKLLLHFRKGKEKLHISNAATPDSALYRNGLQNSPGFQSSDESPTSYSKPQSYNQVSRFRNSLDASEFKKEPSESNLGRGRGRGSPGSSGSIESLASMDQKSDT